MIELFIVGSLAVATVRTAKGRGASPWLYGSMAVLGFLLLRLGLASVLASVLFEEDVPGSGAVVALNLAAGIVPYLCPVLVYFYVRSVPGRSHAQPAGQWTCQECRWLNSATVFKCEACGSEYQVDRLTT